MPGKCARSGPPLRVTRPGANPGPLVLKRLNLGKARGHRTRRVVPPARATEVHHRRPAYGLLTGVDPGVGRPPIARSLGTRSGLVQPRSDFPGRRLARVVWDGHGRFRAAGEVKSEGL